MGLLLGLGIPSASASDGSCVVVVCSSSSPPPSAPAPGSTSPTTAAPTSTTVAPQPKTSSSTTPQSTVDDPSGEMQMLAMVNQARAQAGVAPLTMRDDIRSIAVHHSFDMAAAGYIYHNDNYFSSSTRSQLHAAVLGENVDMNYSIEAAHQALMNSPHHRDNILDPRFVYVGIGAVETSSGTFYITQDFVQPADGWRPAAAAPAAAGGGHGSGLAAAVPVSRDVHAQAAAAAPAAAPVAEAPALPSIDNALLDSVAGSLRRGTKTASGPSGLLLLTCLGGLVPGVGGLVRLRLRRVHII